MSTFGTMQDRIADEIARTDLTTQIKRAIQTVIRHYERERFFFNENQATFTTSISQEYYQESDFASAPSIVEIDSMRVTKNGSTYTLLRRDFAYIDSIQSNSAYTGTPTDYAYYNKKIRLYPIPDAANVMVVSHVTKPATLSATTDTNAWMTEGEEMVRLKAKADIYLNVIRDPQEAVVMEQAARMAKETVWEETVRRISSGRLRPTSF